MEAAVQPAARRRVLGVRQFLGRTAQGLEVRGFGALGGEPGGGAGQGCPVVAEVAQLLGAPAAQPCPEPVVGGDLGQGDEAAAAATPAGGDQALLPQRHERLPQGDRGDAEVSGQFGLAGELLAVGEEAQLYGVAEAADDRVHTGPAVHRAEDRLAGASVDLVLPHGHHLVR